jgi:hypothetical protein
LAVALLYSPTLFLDTIPLPLEVGFQAVLAHI